MSSKPMMKCGHAANAVCSSLNGVKYDPPIPSCVICDCHELVPAPDLTGRKAVCSYRNCKQTMLRKHGRNDKPDYGDGFNERGQAFAASNMNLPFFAHHPDKPVDEYYCGCFGWD